MSSSDCDQLGTRNMLIVMPSRVAKQRFSHGCLFGPWIGRVEHVEPFTFEVRGRQSVGDQDDLSIGRVLGGQNLPSQLQRMLDVGEVRRNLDTR